MKKRNKIGVISATLLAVGLLVTGCHDEQDESKVKSPAVKQTMVDKTAKYSINVEDYLKAKTPKQQAKVLNTMFAEYDQTSLDYLQKHYPNNFVSLVRNATLFASYQGAALANTKIVVDHSVKQAPDRTIPVKKQAARQIVKDLDNVSFKNKTTKELYANLSPELKREIQVARVYNVTSKKLEDEVN